MTAKKKDNVAEDKKCNTRSEDNYSELFLSCLMRFTNLLERQEILLGKILMEQSELAVQVNKVREGVANLLEVLDKEDDVSEELQAAANKLDAAIQGVDDLNPDAIIGNENGSV